MAIKRSTDLFLFKSSLSYLNGVFVAGSAGRPLNVRLFNVLQFTNLLDRGMGGSLLSWGGRVVVCLEGGGCYCSSSGIAPPSRGFAAAMYATCFFLSFFLFFCSVRWEVGGWAATDCPDGQSALYLFPFCDAWVRVTGQVPEDIWRCSWENLPVLSPHWGGA